MTTASRDHPEYLARSSSTPRDPPLLGWIAAAAVAAAGSYLLARYVGLGPAPGPWAYWPINGILLGILLRRPPRQWWAIGLAAVASQILTIWLTRGDLAGGATLVGALGGFVQAALSAAILQRRFAGEFRLDGSRELAWFVAVGVMGVPLVVTQLTALAYAPGLGLSLAAVWGPLYAGDSLSVLLLAPPFVCWHSDAAEAKAWHAGMFEALLCQAGILAMTLVTFAGPDHWARFVALPYTLFPLLAWSALRCRPRWTALAVIGVATVAAWCTARGLGPFGALAIDLNHRVLALQAYLAFVAFTGLVLTALTEEHLHAFAELSLRDSIQLAFFESSVRVLVLTDLEGRFVLMNRAAQAAYGGDGRELIGLHPRDFLPADDVQAIEAHDRRVLERGEALTFEEVLPVEGTRRRLEVTRFPVRDHTGAIRYIGAIARDDALERELTRQLQGAQRVEILGRLAAGVAHDLNNLLTVLVGNARLLEDQPGRPPEEEEVLREMNQAGTEATKLTGRLMALGRPRATPPDAVSPDAVIRDLEPLLAVLVRGNIDLDTTLRAPDGRVQADPTAIEQIVLNLVSNARDAIRGEGTIAITTETVSRGSRGSFRLTVADTGEGMDAATRERIFEPFFTTKQETRGTGLGLYTVAAIVRQAAGEITAASAPGAGTTFVVELPLVEEGGEDRGDPTG